MKRKRSIAVIGVLLTVITVMCSIGMLPSAFHSVLPANTFQDESYNDPQSSNWFSTDPLTQFQLSGVPVYSGKAAIEVNGNVPFFSDSEATTVAAIHLSDLDSLGRCQVASACLGPETVAPGERGSLGMIKPSGWHTVRYNEIEDGNYLYNRCHLLMWKASSILDDDRNLITGTRYMNIQGMLPYEEALLDLIVRRQFHVLYRVTPIFEGKNLVASGVLMEARSVEDAGRELQFCVYAYNVQPGIRIDYATGDSWVDENETAKDNFSVSLKRKYVINKNTKKFHRPDCSSVKQIRPQNRKDVTAGRGKLISKGYVPCGICKP